MIVEWQVDDGYVGNRPQEFEIDDSEFEGLSDYEKGNLIEEYTQEEFNQNISWHITNKD